MSLNCLASPRILVVDDEPLVRDAIALLLSKCEYLIDTASSGEQALALIQVRSYDLILTDMKMPGMDGLQLAKQLKSINIEQKVILVTGFAPADTGTNFHAVLLKPFSVHELRSQVSAVLVGKTESSR